MSFKPISIRLSAHSDAIMTEHKVYVSDKVIYFY